MSEVRILATGLGFPEGPVVMPDGSVILTEIRNGRCSRVTPDGKVSAVLRLRRRAERARDRARRRASISATTAAAATSRACRWGRGRTRLQVRLDPAARSPRPARPRLLYNECDGHKLSAPNDLVFDKAGRLLLHRSRQALCPPSRPWRRLLRAARRLEDRRIAYPILSPNGCGLSPDGKMLYVADTEGARLWAFDVEGPGVLRSPRADCAAQRPRASAASRPARASTAWRCWPAATSPSRR